LVNIKLAIILFQVPKKKFMLQQNLICKHI
jgi:hypothetical protein